ncbi:MAG: hypothetical protein IPJ69_06990 [Deltaproteobacteria bacterium]|nr:MAG: hypothetical protein IPJ69_06990 [Deltaproteobacteria bacterium]
MNTLNIPQTNNSPWLISKRLDLLFFLGGFILVPLPLLIKNGYGLSVTLVNLVITVLIGGPHLFATFTYTFMEKKFWKRHPIYASSALLIPPTVIYLGLNAFGILITIFFSWASIHLLHQTCYIADCYRKKIGDTSPFLAWEKWIDYSVVFSSIYPVAIYKIVNGTFNVANQNIQIPYVTGNPFVFDFVISFFGIALMLFIAKTIWEIKTQTISWPKTALISMTVFVALLIAVPKDLDVAFQGFNTWHSLQYIALAWWVNVVRKDRGDISSPLVNGVSGRGFFKTLGFYTLCLMPTLGFLAIITLLARSSGLPYNKCYFTVTLSGLLIHYYFDHWLFTKTKAIVPV